MSGSSFSRTASIAFMLGIVVAGCGHESREQPAQPTAPEVTTIAAQNVLTNSICLRLILVPAGEFMMGGRESPDELIRAFGREAVNPGALPPPQDIPALRGVRVLVVDDHQTNRTILERQLGNLGMDVRSAVKLESEVSYALVREFRHFPLEHLSWRGDPPDPMPLA